MMGPEPIIRIFLMSVRFGMLFRVRRFIHFQYSPFVIIYFEVSSLAFSSGAHRETNRQFVPFHTYDDNYAVPAGHGILEREPTVVAFRPHILGGRIPLVRLRGPRRRARSKSITRYFISRNSRNV